MDTSLIEKYLKTRIPLCYIQFVKAINILEEKIKNKEIIYRSDFDLRNLYFCIEQIKNIIKFHMEQLNKEIDYEKKERIKLFIQHCKNFLKRYTSYINLVQQHNMELYNKKVKDTDGRRKRRSKSRRKRRSKSRKKRRSKSRRCIKK